MIVHKLLPDGGFVAGDTKTRRTAYAYPTSPHATIARAMPNCIAAEMMTGANAMRSWPTALDDYDERNWQRLEG